MSTRVCFPSRLSIEQSKGKKLYELVGLVFVEILASKVVAQVIAQEFVQGKVSAVYSLKLLHSGEFPSQDMQSFWMTFHCNVYVFFFFIFFSFCLSTKTKCGSC